MYERINDKSAQQAIQQKVAAAQQHDMGATLRSALGAVQVQGINSMPPIDQEYQRLCEALSGLDSSVSELLERISPVLQPGSLSDAKEAISGHGNAVEAAPSEMRMKLIKARQWVETISAKIAPIRYTIEL